MSHRNRFPLIRAKHAAFALMAAPSLAVANPSWECLEPALEAELAQKLNFQAGFAAAIVEARPDLEEAAGIAADATNESFKIRFARTVWLWQVDPGRFSDADAFWVFAWSDEDEAAWRAADPSHLAAADRVDALRNRFRSLATADAYRSFVSENRTEEPFLGLATDFGDALAADRARVADCF